MLEALSFCDRERVLPSSIKMTVLTFLVKKKPGEIKLQEVSMFLACGAAGLSIAYSVDITQGFKVSACRLLCFEHTRKKKIKSNLVLVVGGHMSNI